MLQKPLEKLSKNYEWRVKYQKSYQQSSLENIQAEFSDFCAKYKEHNKKKQTKKESNQIT